MGVALTPVGEYMSNDLFKRCDECGEDTFCSHCGSCISCVDTVFDSYDKKHKELQEQVKMLRAALCSTTDELSIMIDNCNELNKRLTPWDSLDEPECVDKQTCYNNAIMLESLK